MNDKRKRQFQRDYPILIPYQIDFNTTTVGRHIRQTKRHVTWRFGFTHIPSVLDHKTGVACRGLEMDIHLVWSVASGKHILYLNNVLLHQTFPSSSSYAMVPAQRFEHSMYVPEEIIPGGHVIHITAWALGFGSHASPENQFLMTFDGQSYREFYPIYKLGSPEMREKYSLALEKAREKLSRLRGDGNDDDDDGDREEEMVAGEGSMRMTDGRNISNYHATVDRYWEKSTVPLPARVQTTTLLYPTKVSPSPSSSQGNPPFRHRSNSNASAPDLLPPDIRPGDVARNDREEETLLARARLESFRDLKRQQEHRARMATAAASKHLYAKDQRQEEQYLAQARIHSFRDIRGDVGGGGTGDDASMAMSIPSFARPPVATSKSAHRAQHPTSSRYHHPQSSHLKPVKEGVDLLDLDDDSNNQESHGNRLMRSESSVTLDTAIKSPDDDLMSLTSGISDVYSHLDPRQNWRTQQNVSFRLQKPPVYADTLAGDLIQPSASFVYDVAHEPLSSYSYGNSIPGGGFSGGSTTSNVWQQASTYAGRNMEYSRNNIPSNSTPMAPQGAGFVAAPPPTWESLQEAFAVPPSNSSHARHPASWQQPVYRQYP